MQDPPLLAESVSRNPPVSVRMFRTSVGYRFGLILTWRPAWSGWHRSFTSPAQTNYYVLGWTPSWRRREQRAWGAWWRGCRGRWPHNLASLGPRADKQTWPGEILESKPKWRAGRDGRCRRRQGGLRGMEESWSLDCRSYIPSYELASQQNELLNILWPC